MKGMRAILLTGFIAAAGAWSPAVVHRVASKSPDAPRVSTNDNRRSAGTLHDGRLELKLEIVNGRWFPEAENGTNAIVPAFAEEGRAPEIPGPLIRVPEGTRIHLTIHNTLAGPPVFIHGLQSHPTTSDDTEVIATGATKEINFAAGAAGTYYYWASIGPQAMIEHEGSDAMLSGALIVDPPTGVNPRERVFLINVWRSALDSAGYPRPDAREIVVVNGKSWPYTEQFTYSQGDTVYWRWINPSNAPHPMHLHGFYYDVDRHGGPGVDSVSTTAEITHVNTRTVPFGGTMAMHFVPDRPGNWLFHCHLAVHVDATSTLRNIVERRALSEVNSEQAHMGHSHGIMDMAGLIIGFHVLPRGPQVATDKLEPQRRRLFVQSSPRGNPARPAIGFVLQNGPPPARDSVSMPGPALVLEARRPARVTVINHLKWPTAVHWHGMEIDSYPDGVPGWSGMPGGSLMPPIQPNDSFVAAFTPPHAGTFIYHSHMNELMQTNSGMYGALIVTDSTHSFDPRTDKVVLVGGGGPGSVEVRSTGLVNGTTRPVLQLEAGTTYRLRLIQIHPQAVVAFRLGTDTSVDEWTPVAKDGADLPPTQSTKRAAFTVMGAGETADFLFTPSRPGLETLSMTTRAPGWFIPMQLVIKPAPKVATR